MPITRFITYQCLVGFLLMVVIVVQATPVEAARSSKPKEIVVVGSKIKEVVKEVGLDISDRVVLTLSHRLVGSLRDAFTRAEKNRRYVLISQDISYRGQPDDEEEQLLDEESLMRFVPERGFELGPDFLSALNHQANWLLDLAIERAQVNDRSTIESYDF